VRAHTPLEHACAFCCLSSTRIRSAGMTIWYSRVPVLPADVHMLLGDVAMETERFDSASADYAEAIALLRAHLQARHWGLLLAHIRAWCCMFQICFPANLGAATGARSMRLHALPASACAACLRMLCLPAHAVPASACSAWLVPCLTGAAPI
jgi:hypothetical protein